MSKQFSINKHDSHSLVRGLGISVLAVALSYVATNVIPTFEASALTPQAAMIVALASNAVNFLQRFIRHT